MKIVRTVSFSALLPYPQPTHRSDAGIQSGIWQSKTRPRWRLRLVLILNRDKLRRFDAICLTPAGFFRQIAGAKMRRDQSSCQRWGKVIKACLSLSLSFLVAESRRLLSTRIVVKNLPSQWDCLLSSERPRLEKCCKCSTSPLPSCKTDTSLILYYLPTYFHDVPSLPECSTDLGFDWVASRGLSVLLGGGRCSRIVAKMPEMRRGFWRACAMQPVWGFYAAASGSGLMPSNNRAPPLPSEVNNSCTAFGRGESARLIDGETHSRIKQCQCILSIAKGNRHDVS